jgi:phage gp36-like protein
MAYTDKDYFLQNISEEELQNLTEDEEENTANLDAKIASADSLIDSYLASAVPLPLTTVPDIIMQCSFDIAMYYLHARTDYKDVPEAVKTKYDAAIDYLEKVAKKIVILPGITVPSTDNQVQFDGEDADIDRGSY